MKNYLFTSESVSEGHPDKVSDQVSDAVLDAIISKDKKARVACETLTTTGLVLIAGEVTTSQVVDIPTLARETIKNIGYDSDKKGFDYKTCSVQVCLDRQSPDIAMGVDRDSVETQGAGDQGIMFGYAVNETPELMPMTISLSHKLVQELAHLRKNGADFIWPDSKSQVTVEYVDGKAKRIDAVVISTQHADDVTLEKVQDYVRSELIDKVIPVEWVDAKTKYFINPTGRFVTGGPQGDCGLTGRKIIVDTYGGHGAHGGGAFSGKDPSKVDRSAAYAARNVAKTIVAAGLADKCLVQLAYAIGIAEPVSIMVNDYGTSKVDAEELSKAVSKVWDLRPGKIIEEFDLLRPIYSKTAAYGHFGREELEFSWEKVTKKDALLDRLNIKGSSAGAGTTVRGLTL